MEFTIDELRLIKVMCVTACPQYPNVPMWEPWASVYDKADRMLHNMEQSLKACICEEDFIVSECPVHGDHGPLCGVCDSPYHFTSEH